MHVERIRIQAFGRLEELDTGPEPLGDLVVVLGPNEAGKTTLFQFLATVLYGFHPASRDAHPYTPWSGAEPAGIALLRLDDGTQLEVHRRLLSTPGGTLVRDGTTEDIRNRTLPAAEHVPLSVFRQVYAISLSELAGLGGESWACIQDRLIAGMGASDLRPARLVADELDAEAGELWRPHRRGNQALRRLRERLRELEARRRDVAEADRVLRAKVREREHILADLGRARAERESCEVYIERFRALLPIRSALQRVHSLHAEAEPAAALADLPADPATRLAELDRIAAEQEARVSELTRERDAAGRRCQPLRPADTMRLERRTEVERVTARVGAAGWMRARAGQLEQELRELGSRLETEASELFEVPWDQVDTDPVRALPTTELRSRARVLDEIRLQGEALRETARRQAEHATWRSSDPDGVGRLTAAAVVVLGGALLTAGAMKEHDPLTVLGALVLGAGLMLFVTALRRPRRPRAPGPAPPDFAALHEREAEARRELIGLLGGLPVRDGVLKRGLAQLVTGTERIQQLVREQRNREAEKIRLRREAAALDEDLAGLAAACQTEVPPDPVAAAHLLAAAATEAGRREAAAERAGEEHARLEGTCRREEHALTRLRADAASLRARLTSLGDGDLAEGLRRFLARKDAAAQAASLRADLERAHPDLEDIRARIRQAEEAGEDWVVDEEALARRRVRLPELTDRVETLARKEAALEQEIEHLAGGETLDRIDGETAVLAEQLRRVERERDRKHVLARLVREADRRFREEHQPELVRCAGEHLAAITAGRYSRVLLADGTGEPSFRVRSDGAPRPIPVEGPLSTGTREQVYLALRLAALDQLDRDGERLPIFLDEALVNWDPERRDCGLDLLSRIARRRQVFVFTCQPAAAQRLAARGARTVRLDPER